jgi:hypothetical protein
MTNHGLVIFAPLAALALAIFAFFRSSRGGRVINQIRPNKGDPNDANAWKIGPVDNQGNQSKNMPEHPTKIPTGELMLDLATPAQEPHYITIDHGPLTGRMGIRIKGRVEGGPIVAKDGVSAATLCAYFQRRSDDWAATFAPAPGHGSGELNQGTEYYRWFCTSKAIPLTPGPFDFTALFSDVWTALQASSEDNKNPHFGANYFRQALADAGESGFVLGGGDGWGHGVRATSPAKIYFTVEFV